MPMRNLPTRTPRFVVYHIASTMEKEKYYFAHHAAALVKKLNTACGEERYAFHTIEHYRTKVVHMVTRKNLLSGEEYQEPSNTPGYMSPSRESYWSM